GLQPATSARGLVTFSNERGPLTTITLNTGVEVRAGQIPFRTDRGLDILPIQTELYYKTSVPNPPAQLVEYYKQLYASFQKDLPPDGSLALYQTVPFSQR